MALGTINISVGLVNTTIGEGSNDVMALCVSNRINKWSKYKPVDSTEISNIYGISGADTTILAAKNYGLSATKNANFKTAHASGWTYTKPSSIFRLGDFRNYEHAAVEPMQIGIADTVQLNSLYVVSMNLTAIVASGASATNVTIDNVPSVADYYFGVVLETSGGLQYPITSATKLSAGGAGIPLDFALTPFIGSVVLDAYLCLFEEARIQGSAIGDNYYLPLLNNSTTKKIFSFIHEIGLSSINTKITAQATPNFTLFFDKDQFIFIPPYPEDPEYLGSAGAVFFKLRLTNTTSSKIPFDVSKLSFDFDKTLNRTSAVNVPAKTYIDNVLQTGIVDINASGGYIDVVVGHPQVLGYDASDAFQVTLTSSQKTIIPILKYKTTQVTAFGAIRFKGTTT